MSVGGSDMCHSCKKRVYVMERLSAEGYFFHRECFRCEECLSTLRLGGHAFNAGHGMPSTNPHNPEAVRQLLWNRKLFLRFLRRGVYSF